MAIQVTSTSVTPGLEVSALLLSRADEAIEQRVDWLRLLTAAFGPKRRKSMSAQVSAIGDKRNCCKQS